ncbi:MAG TPA: integrase core domain-containing protein [Bryobacteraceae bacterium]|jgi:transposase InsO family protein|nr:integrase core domain-containing protein [Bryobacteraceae bacterium]
MSRQILSCGGSANGSADSGPGFPTRSAGVAVAPAPLKNSADCLIRDRDSRYSADVRLRIQSLGMQEILTASRSPWQNPYAERLISSIRRECLNHYIILNARHLKRTLSSYFRYYHESRTHLGLANQCPFPREALNVGKIVAIPQLGGLHHRYERIAA